MRKGYFITILTFVLLSLRINAQDCKFDYKKVDKFTGKEVKGFKYDNAAKGSIQRGNVGAVGMGDANSFEFEIVMVNCHAELLIEVDSWAKIQHTVSRNSEIILIIGEGETLKIYTSEPAKGYLGYTPGYRSAVTDLTNVPNSGIYTSFALKIKLTKDILTKLSSSQIKDVRIPKIPYCFKDYSIKNKAGKDMMKAMECISSMVCNELETEQIPTSETQQQVSSTTESAVKSGLFEKKYPSGNIKEKGYYKNDKKIGLWKTYRDDGQLEEAVHYDANGLRDSITTTYQRNGKVASRTEYKNDLMNGKHFFYGDNGSLKEELIYTNNKRQGLCLEYNDKAKKICEGTYVDDKKDGKWLFYDSVSGKITRTTVYKNGVIQQ